MNCFAVAVAQSMARAAATAPKVTAQAAASPQIGARAAFALRICASEALAGRGRSVIRSCALLFRCQCIERAVGQSCPARYGQPREETRMSISRYVWLGLLASIAALTAASVPASAQQQQKPNILFIMGDDIGWMQPSIYHRRPDGRGNAQHRPHRAGRREVHGLRGHAELHLRSQCLLHRHVSAAHRHDPAAAAGQPVLSATRHPGHRQVPARSRLQHRRVRQEPPRRPHRVAADGARLPGILGLSLPPRRDAAGELPRHQQDPDRAGRRAAVPQHAGSGPPGGPRRRGPQDDDLSDATAPGHLVQVLRRDGEEPDVQ